MLVCCSKAEHESNDNSSDSTKVEQYAINVSPSIENADIFVYNTDGSYILMDLESKRGCGMIHLNSSVNNTPQEGVTYLINNEGKPLMMSFPTGHIVFKNVTDSCFDFAYVDSAGKIEYYRNIKIDDSLIKATTRASFDNPWNRAFESLYYDVFKGGWDEHNTKALGPYLIKVLCLTLASTTAVGLVVSVVTEASKSMDKECIFTDIISMAGIPLNEMVHFEGDIKIIKDTKSSVSLSLIVNLINDLVDDELEELGRLEEQVGPVLDPEEWKISLSQNYLDCTPDDSVYVVDVISKAMWEIDDSQIDHNWCEVKKLDGQVAIHVKPNKQEYDRTCNLIIYPKTTMGIVAIEPVTLPIKQTGIVFELSPDKLTFLMFGGSEPVLVKTNEFINEWKITSWPSWCNYEKATTTLWVRVDKNEIEDRDGYITITGITKGGMFIDRQLKVEQKAALCPDDNHPHAISLGLPSGTKWACCNVEGDYSWGETEPKAWYNMGWYKYFDNEKYECKYIGSDIAGTQYDVAHVKWGASWHMPSRAQFQELLDNCTSVLDSYYGLHRGILVGPNGNAIHLPFNGFLSNDYGVGVGSSGFYWSSTCNENEPNCAYYLRYELNSGPRMYSGDSYYTRFYGFSVRPVQ